MVSCDGFGCGFPWIFLIMMVLMFAGCFFMMMRMRGKGNSMDCCTRSKSGKDDKHELPQI